jgi:hypothetical protein
MGRLGCRRLRDAVATLARQLRTHVANDADHRRHVVQHFGDVLAQTVQSAAAFGTGAGCGVFHSRARQVFGERPARRLAPSGVRRFGCGGMLGSAEAVSAICSSRSPRISSNCSTVYRLSMQKLGRPVS